MPELTPPLPSDHAFVIQLQESRGDEEVCRCGRVEHLASGEAMRFNSAKEFWVFVDRVLSKGTRMRKSQVKER